MKTLIKSPEKDFVILNLTDPQLGNGEWDKDHKAYKILTYTLHELIRKVQPDLITVTGDISWGEGHFDAYKNFAELMQSCGIPWAPVWGNHDNEDGADIVEEIADLYGTYSTCLFEKGDPALGSGNYIIKIEENGKIVEALFMMDTHADNDITLLDRNCVPQTYGSYASLTPLQLEWYKEQVQEMKKQGCQDSSLFVHIPLYGYREAFYAATEEDLRAPESVSLADSYKGIGWKDGYKETCFGVNREGIASTNYNDGVRAVLEECGITKNVVAGHEHINNFSIPFNGIRYTYATKIGPGCYWPSDLNGGTVLTVTSEGVSELRHEYVDVEHIVNAE